ncbi:MAG: putative cytosolic protein [Deltaproteobacteria bacterium]|jgi:uncharacterized protein (DUF169 family)|nr:putative cytosolic protein [Deltaproteobacteria bacterium]
MDLKRYEKFYEALGLREHPLGIYYTDRKPAKGLTPKEGTHICLIGMLNRARQKGDTVYFDENHTGCFGGAYYLGFRDQARPHIEYFLSCGIPGEMEGERYIKTPELAKDYFAAVKPRQAPAKFCIFKPLNKFQAAEEPEVVAFFASPDILSGLFTLTNYAAERMDAVRIPFSSGCGSVLTHPLKEAENERPQAILGMFDVSTRPFVEPNLLTLAMPVKLFLTLLDNLDESFLITESWRKVRERIRKTQGA